MLCSRLWEQTNRQRFVFEALSAVGRWHRLGDRGSRSRAREDNHIVQPYSLLLLSRLPEAPGKPLDVQQTCTTEAGWNNRRARGSITRADAYRTKTREGELGSGQERWIHTSCSSRRTSTCSSRRDYPGTPFGDGTAAGQVLGGVGNSAPQERHSIRQCSREFRTVRWKSQSREWSWPSSRSRIRSCSCSSSASAARLARTVGSRNSQLVEGEQLIAGNEVTPRFFSPVYRGIQGENT